MPATSKEISVVHQHFAPSFFKKHSKGLKKDVDYAMDAEDLQALCEGFGIGVTDKAAKQIFDGDMIDFAMDANNIAQLQTTASISTPIQFLQNWLPGVVRVVTAKRAIDEFVGRTTIGSWEDEEIVQQVVALTGAAQPYQDTTNAPMANWNQTFLTRKVVRFELALKVGNLEQARSSRVRIDSAATKRTSIAVNLEIQRNAVGFYGYNSGAGNTYGILNDPNLPAYVSTPNAGWATATFQEIVQDLLTAIQGLRTQSADLIEPDKQALTLGLPTNSIDYLSTTTDFGYSVWDWLEDNYPGIRTISAPQLNGANGGQNVFYLYADTVNDSGTDDEKTFIQVVPAVYQLQGIQKLAKSYEEDYSNATAGVMLKRPYAVYRATGI